MAQPIDSTKIGQLAAQYASDVPLELIGAVFKTESNYGSDPAAYVPNSSGAIGPGQILAKALGAKYGNFEAYMPGGNPNDPEQATIAALKKINADWRRSGDSIENFSKLYFGNGADAAGRTAMNHYVPKLMEAMQKQSSDQSYWNLVQGAMGGAPQMDVGTPSNTLGENRLQFMLDNGGPSLSPASAYATAAISSADSLVEQLTKSYTDLAKAKTGVDQVEANSKVELAKQTETLLSAMGLNMKDTGSTIQQTGVALQKAVDKLRADQANLQQSASNPFFNLFDAVSGGAASKFHNANINRSAQEVKVLTAAVQELQTTAEKQLKLQPNISAAAVENEVKAKAAVYQAEATINADKVGLRQAIQKNQAEIQQARLELQQAGLNIRQQMADIAATRASATKGLTFSQQMKVDSEKAEEELVTDTAKAMGMTPGDYVKFLTKNKHLSGYMVNSDGSLPIPLVMAKANLGKYTPAQKKLFDSAFSQFTGWAVPTSPNANGTPGIDYIPPGLDEAEKGAKSQADKQAIREGTIIAIAQKKRDFILNRGTTQDQEANPYAANFDRVAEFAKLPEFVKANPLVDQVAKSKLYTDLQAKNAKNSFDKQAISDQEVLKHAAHLLDSRQLTPDEASKQVADYFKAQVEMNNYAKQFKEFGLPTQESYRVPIVEGSRDLVVEFRNKKSKDGRETPSYNMFDLTSEQKVKAALLMANRPWFAGVDTSPAQSAIHQIMTLIAFGPGAGQNILQAQQKTLDQSKQTNNGATK